MLLTPSPLITSPLVAPLPIRPITYRSNRSRYYSRIFSCMRFPNRINGRCLSMKAVKPGSALVKESSGSVGSMNWLVNSYWDDLIKKDDKFKCRWRKSDTVADVKEEKQLKRRNTEKNTSTTLYAVLVGASFCVAVTLCSLGIQKLPSSQYIDVPYSHFVDGIQDGSVTSVQFVENSRQIYFNKDLVEEQNVQTSETDSDSLTAQFERAVKKYFPKWQYHTRNVEDYTPRDLVRMLEEKGITYGSNRALLSASTKNFLFVFFQVAPFWIMVLLTFYQLNLQHDLGKMTKKTPSKKQSLVTFDDVKGVDAAKTELLEIVLCMKGDSKYIKLGAKPPKGVLLAGPPGTGKTLLARAVAGEAGMSFFSISGSELVEVFVGRGAARVRDLFSEARKNSPSIIFIDEIDAVGGQRGRTLNCERDQTLNQLLTEMDGFEKEESVVVIAATNRPETLDSALMRPGRFSRKVRVGEPNESGRKDIFALYLKNVPFEDDKEDICEVVASLTPGLVGADLENIVRESVLLAARRGGEVVTKDDIFQAVDRAKGKVYDHVAAGKPFPFGPSAQAHAQGGSMGFGFPN
ncbi:putative AAA+ ATPase domain, ATPase, AAA-type, core, peptidase M41, FtsH extracellular [Helianthus annuus]|uniref:AAA+ ATPase domain, ATPase, AAA-type, core, peptidase M41, FtsH extracellular n=1 Tax=Helianthus annuus TaxID=4232 RepID=A0A251TX45_HELAN|nr:probable inactive ATP-dependent zinc metalloprotease FTSHI 3, chloroplastic [Helianthus annuus]KAF5791863.1 putative AAA+ ATPase domain, ATPase, AAA-type, core, peptidase M41, FtsH extracellular [Helianthus annuus]KAJ0526878.1 putative AAA+ ATPase domain, ATPase, AAA-type, core, peptidase M41, FtsH extracellular [Helianthus annuus]KAJ0543273.1 putative AAA+ ATPase domain, ATPase, AAA-type, core, peptidase M41, FtsH extracellular [Helianthus annuus]KAJ0708329.1 putative AAA+ ATPase domain, AT